MLVYRSVSFKILTFALIFFWNVVCFTLPLFKVHNWLPRATSNVMPLRDLWRQYESVKSTADRDLEKYPDVIRSLAVKPVYASQILSGTKSWEVRRKHTHVRERVAIYASSTKTYLGNCHGPGLCLEADGRCLELSVSHLVPWRWKGSRHSQTEQFWAVFTFHEGK